MPTKKAASTQVAVINTRLGETFILKGAPTEAEIQGFVAEHHRRYVAGLPGGPNGDPAREITDAAFYPSHEAYLEGAPGKEIDITEHIGG